MSIASILGLGSNNKSASRPVFNKYAKQGAKDFHNSLKGMSYENRVKLEKSLKDDFKGKSLSNDKILKIVCDRHGSAMKDRVKKELVPRTKAGLTQEQIKRNVNFARFRRGEESVENLQKDLHGITRGRNIASGSNYGSTAGIQKAGAEAIGLETWREHIGQFALNGKDKTVSVSKENTSNNIKNTPAPGTIKKPIIPLAR